jgi:hypothetical protein
MCAFLISSNVLAIPLLKVKIDMWSHVREGEFSAHSASQNLILLSISYCHKKIPNRHKNYIAKTIPFPIFYLDKAHISSTE